MLLAPSSSRSSSPSSSGSGSCEGTHSADGFDEKVASEIDRATLVVSRVAIYVRSLVGVGQMVSSTPNFSMAEDLVGQSTSRDSCCWKQLKQ